MGFLTPSLPKPPKISPPAKNDVNRAEADKVSDTKRKRRLKNSSQKNSVRGGAVNPNYTTGTKTAQGQ